MPMDKQSSVKLDGTEFPMKRECELVDNIIHTTINSCREGVVACAPRVDAAAGGLGDELEREGPAVEDVSVGASRGPDGPSDAEARRELRAGAEVRRGAPKCFSRQVTSSMVRCR